MATTNTERSLFGRLFSKNGEEGKDANCDNGTSRLQTGGAYCSLDQLMALRLSAQQLTLPKARRVSRPQSGSHRSRFRGRGMEFSEVRTYQPGDDVRSIDWRVTARRQTPHTKLFNEERERPILLICDQSAQQFFGSTETFKSVKAAEAAALFAWSALNQNDRVGGIVFSDQGHEEVRPARNRKTILRLLNTITQFNSNLSSQAREKSFGLNDALREAVRVARPGTLIVIISDFIELNHDSAAELSLLSQHNELVLVQTYDPLERELPPPGLYPMSDGVHSVMFDAQSNSARQDYQTWIEQHQQAVRTTARRYRAPLIEVSTADDTLKALHPLLISAR